MQNGSVMSIRIFTLEQVCKEINDTASSDREASPELDAQQRLYPVDSPPTLPKLHAALRHLVSMLTQPDISRHTLHRPHK